MIKNLFILILTLSTLYFGCNYFRMRKSIDVYFPDVSYVRTDTPTTIRYTDPQGIEHTVQKSQMIDVAHKEAIRQVQNLNPYLDTLSRSLDIKTRQLESVTSISTRTEVRNLELQIVIDSLKKTKYVYRDKYLDLSVTPPEDTLGTALVNFSYDADLNIYQYWKRKNLLGLPLGNRESYTDISSRDNRTTIRGLKTFTVKQRIPSFGLRGQVRTSYTPSTGSFSIGPALRFDLGPVSLGFTTYYNLQDRQWRPNITTDYTIF